MNTKKILEYVEGHVGEGFKIEDLIPTMKREKKDEVERYGERRAFISWMQGIPSAFPAGFETYEQEELLADWHVAVPKDGEEIAKKFYGIIYDAILSKMEWESYEHETVPTSEIVPGDFIMCPDGRARTVTKKDIRNGFIGITIFGYTFYDRGERLVERCKRKGDRIIPNSEH